MASNKSKSAKAGSSAKKKSTPAKNSKKKAPAKNAARPAPKKKNSTTAIRKSNPNSGAKSSKNNGGKTKGQEQALNSGMSPLASNNNPLKPKTRMEKQLLALKRKMHREIFEKCLEKHFITSITEWDEIEIPDKDAGDDD